LGPFNENGQGGGEGRRGPGILQRFKIGLPLFFANLQLLRENCSSKKIIKILIIIIIYRIHKFSFLNIVAIVISLKQCRGSLALAIL
jgi:hypothetical protein